MPRYWTLDTADKRKHFMEHVVAQTLAGKKVTVEFVEPKRSQAQSNAMWLWAEQVAQFLNDAGLDQRIVLRDDAPIPWTKNAVIDQMWRPVEKAMIGSDSTRDMTKTQVSDIYETIVRHIASSQGVTLPKWPHTPPVSDDSGKVEGSGYG